MAEALLSALKNKGVQEMKDVMLYDVNDSRLGKLIYGVILLPSNRPLVRVYAVVIWLSNNIINQWSYSKC